MEVYGRGANMMSPQFSIIIPVYNGEKYIERCLKSVLQQTYHSYEVVIINDGSTDSTVEICNKYKFDRRVKLISKKNEGVSVARNMGLEVSKGKFILFVDSDDYVPCDMCENFLQVMTMNVDLCIADFVECMDETILEKDNIGNVLQSGVYSLEEFGNMFGELYKRHFLNSPWGKCYRRDKINSVFPVDVNLGEDLLFNLYYITACRNIVISDKKNYYYCIQKSDSLSTAFRISAFDMLHKVYWETKTMVSRICDVEKCPIKEVDEKYVVDMTTMFERLTRTNRLECKSVTIDELYQKYKLSAVFDASDVSSYGIKINVKKRLLEKHRYELFIMLSRMLYRIKQIFYWER